MSAAQGAAAATGQDAVAGLERQPSVTGGLCKLLQQCRKTFRRGCFFNTAYSDWSPCPIASSHGHRTKVSSPSFLEGDPVTAALTDSAQLVDHEGVIGRPVVLEHHGAERGRHAGRVDLILDQNRNTVQRACEPDVRNAASSRSASASASGLMVITELMLGPCLS